MALVLHDALNGAAAQPLFPEVRRYLTAFFLAAFPSKSTGAQAVPSIIRDTHLDVNPVSVARVDLDIDEPQTEAMVYRVK